MMTDEKLLAGIVKTLNERVFVVSRQLEKMYEGESRAFGMPEWYNHHDYASGAFKAKHDSLQQEFDFLNKLITNIENAQ